MKAPFNKIRKQLHLLLILLFISQISFSQKPASTLNIKPDPRLYECFPKDYVDGLQSNPRLLLYYNFYLDNAFFVSEPTGKASNGLDISEVTYKEPGPNGEIRRFDEDLSKFDVKKFNALKYNFKISPGVYTHFVLGKTGKVLVFYPQLDFTKKYNEYLKSYHLDTAK
ncbi:MAG: hypothetical protein NTU44_01675 [Bacteroidetes bacterium]|nr:hypothetical protein [Bacteroidota bacterium]